ncbi:hypothetical protein MHJ98_07940 [Corynebacterium afermentans]|uniref:hypothetical protein n=1 Tax=Corynebacterium afermentans TaxID=38286 RepID=UPI0025748B54|nr:hypothetical protein [Corynebacterium afermentans]MCG7292277.1 hypothetical protein [Corynebacterium afermentans]
MTTPSTDQEDSKSSSESIFPLAPEPKTQFGLLPLSKARIQTNHLSQFQYWALIASLLYLSALLASAIQFSQQLGNSTATLSGKNPFSIEVIIILFPLLASLYMFLQSPAGLSSIELLARSRIRNVIENCFIGIALIGITGEMLPPPGRDSDLPMPPSSNGSSSLDVMEAIATLATLFICQPAITFFRALNWNSLIYFVVIATAGWIGLFIRSVFSKLPEHRALKLADLRRQTWRLENDLRRLVVSPWTFPQTVRALHRNLNNTYDQDACYPCKYALAFVWRLLVSTLLAFSVIKPLILFDLATQSWGWLMMAWAESLSFAVAEYLMTHRLRKMDYLLLIYAFLFTVAFFGLGLIDELNAGNYWFILIFVPLAATLWAGQLRTHFGFPSNYPDDQSKLWDPKWRAVTASSLKTHYAWGSAVDAASLRVAFGGLNATRWRGMSAQPSEKFSFLNRVDPWRNKRFTWMINYQIAKLISDRDSKIAQANELERQIAADLTR